MWDDIENVKRAISQSSSMHEVFLALGLIPNNTDSYRKVRAFAREHELTLPKSAPRKRGNKFFLPSDEIFKEGSGVSRTSLKRRLLEDGILEYKCYGEVCASNPQPLNHWDGITLQLEHINGNANDNRKENLTLLCPNYHSMTATFGSGTKVRYENVANGSCKRCGRRSRIAVCFKCGPSKASAVNVSLETLALEIQEKGLDAAAEIYSREPKALRDLILRRIKKVLEISGLYSEVDPDGLPRQKRVQYPPVAELVSRVKREGYRAVGRDLGVSDNGLRKHIRKTLERSSRSKGSLGADE